MEKTTKNDFRPRIIGIITARNRHDPQAWEELQNCDMAEFRGDLWDSSRILPELIGFRSECIQRFGKAKETIFTLRLKRDGGAWPDETAQEREKIWLDLGQNPAGVVCEWMDLELEALPELGSGMQALVSSRKIKVIVSHHNMQSSYPAEALADLGNKLLRSGAHGVKLAVTCANRGEVLDLMHLARALSQENANASILSMGSIGRPSRVLGPILGCPLTYGYLTGMAVAPGQLSTGELRRFFQSGDFDALTGLSEEALLDWAEARISGEPIAK